MENLKKENTKDKKIKKKNSNFKIKLNKFKTTEIIEIFLVVLNVVSYFTLNKVINIVMFFLAIMFAAFALIYLVGLIFADKEKRIKFLKNIIEITTIIYILIIGIMLGQICKCGNHYFYIVPLILLEVACIISNRFVLNNKNQKDNKSLKYYLIYFIILNIVFASFIILSKVDMQKIHSTMYIL